MSIEHTPIPWTVGEDVGKARRCLVTAEDRDICTFETHYDDDEANARFTIRACNSHDELLEACQKGVDELNTIRARDGVPYMYSGEKSSVDPEYFYGVVDEMFAAIAKATEQE